MTGMSGRRCGVAAGVEGLLVVVAVLLVASVLGFRHARSGRRIGREQRGLRGAGSDDHLPRLTAADLGEDLGERATLVQFSTAFCQPCRATRRVLADVSRDVAGVAHIEIDAESRLELVRRLQVRRTPTVLVLDASGRVVRRASGQPRTADVVAALGRVISA
jgi:thiol-disulfide isomerase/thioredoxin